MSSYKDRDKTILKYINNPSLELSMIHECPEVTFIGSRDQPDYGTLTIEIKPNNKVIELKSLKDYLFQ